MSSNIHLDVSFTVHLHLHLLLPPPPPSPLIIRRLLLADHFLPCLYRSCPAGASSYALGQQLCSYRLLRSIVSVKEVVVTLSLEFSLSLTPGLSLYASLHARSLGPI